MYGDTSTIRAFARQFRERAEEIRSEAERVDTRAAEVAWQGLAAAAMRARTEQRTAALRRTAELHDLAAGALDAHAAEVDRIKSLIAAVERQARDLLAAAGDGLDTVGGLLDRFTPPLPGSRDWLGVDLPGLL
jgi:uncharacterized protein YukE